MSTVGRDVRHGLGIARIELRRSWRKSVATRRQRLVLLGVLLVFAPMGFFWVSLAHEAGREAAKTGSISLDVLGGQLVLLAVAFVVMSAMRIVQMGRPEGDALLLTATSPRAVLLGLLLHSTLQWVAFLLIPITSLAAGFGLGAGTPVVVAATLIAIFPLLAATTAFGTVLGQLFVLGSLQSRLVRRASQLLGVVLLIVLMGLSYAVFAPDTVGSILPERFSPATVPLGEYVDFLFVGTPFAPSLTATNYLVGGVVIASVPLSFVVADRLAPRLWFADATSSDLLQRDRSAVAEETPDGSVRTSDKSVATRFPPLKRIPSLGIASILWIRWLRVPVRFSPLVFVVVAGIFGLFGAVDDPTSLPWVGGFLGVLAGIYASGAIFGLNPIGDAGDMGIVETLSAMPVRDRVLGHVFAGLWFGVPLTVSGGTLLAWTAGATLVETTVVVVLATVAAVASAGVAVAIGTIFPTLGSTRSYRGYEVATPSQWALVSQTFGTMVLTGIAVLGGASVLFGTELGVDHDRYPVHVVGPILAVCVLVVVGVAGIRFATRHFEPPVSRNG